MRDRALYIEDLVKRYPTGVEALRGVSLDIEDGEFFDIVGFAFGSTELETPSYSPTPVIDTKFVDGLIGAHVDASIRREVYESSLFNQAE